jgi:hypothetical protein
MSDKLEEIDLLKLLAITRELELYEAQITILRMKSHDKYHVTERDQIDGATGQIVRAAELVADGQ